MISPDANAFYVAPWGSDQYDGSHDSPFRSIHKARDAMRESGVDTTYLRGGLYTEGTIELDGRDDGVTIQAYPGEVPQVSGGQLITGWRDEGDGVYSAEIGFKPGYTGSVGGVPLRVADARSGGDHEMDYFYTADEGSGGGHTDVRIKFDPDELKKGDIDVGDTIYAFTLYDWTNYHATIESIDWDNNVIRTDGQTMHYGFNSRADAGAFRVIGHSDFVDEVGELGYSNGRVYVKPHDAQTLLSQGALIAKADTIFHLEDADNVTIDGLHISDAFVDRGDKQLDRGDGVGIFANQSDNLTVSNSDIIGTAYGIHVLRADGAEIFNNYLGYSTIRAITLNGQSSDAEVYNNYADEMTGWLTQQKVVVSFNGANVHVHDNTFHGSIIGSASGSNYNNNVIEYNHMLATDYTNHDWGVLYSGNRDNYHSSGAPFRTWQYNIVENSDFRFIDKSGDRREVDTDVAIYLDDLSNDIRAYGNLVHGQDRTFLIHGGDDNEIINNIVLLEENLQEHHSDDAPGEAFIHIQYRTVYEKGQEQRYRPDDNTIERNIVIGNGSRDYFSDGGAGDYTLDHNLRVNIREASPKDHHSIDTDIDPFVDSANGNFALKPGSQAEALGIRDISGHLARAGASNIDQIGAGNLDLAPPTPPGPQEGYYTVEVTARGELAGDALPELEVSLDGTVIGSARVGASSEVLTFEIEASRASQLELRFTNDYFGGPGVDRNLVIETVSVNGVQVDVLAGVEQDDLRGITEADGRLGRPNETLTLQIDAIDPAPVPLPEGVIMATGFDAGADGFVYADDVMAGTSAPGYADGAAIGGGLEIVLGGVDTTDVQGISGGWSYGFVLASVQQVTLEFSYLMEMSPGFETDEYAELLVLVDGRAVGLDGEEHVAQLHGLEVLGEQSNTTAPSTGAMTASLDLGVLEAGAHTITLGGYTSKKTTFNEVTAIRLDDVMLVGTEMSNEAPLAVDDSVAVGADAAAAIDVLVNDSDPDGDSLSVVAVDDAGMLGTLSLGDDGAVLYDPAGAFVGLGDGAVAYETFTYTVEDGRGGRAQAQATIEVNGVNDAPAAMADAAATTAAEPVTLDVLANDADPDEGDTLSLTGASVAAGQGRVEIVDGRLVYDPAGAHDDLPHGETATVEISYSVADAAGAEAVGSATVTVEGTAVETPYVLIAADFDAGADGFVYADDTFLGTAQPDHADGVAGEGALVVGLGGGDFADIEGMSGGWTRGFTLAGPASVTLAVDVEMTIAAAYEPEELVQALVAVDGALVGDPLAMLSGVGDPHAAPLSTGWQTVTVDLGTLEAGEHTLTLGGFNNRKTWQNEAAELRFDDVLVTATGIAAEEPSPTVAITAAGDSYLGAPIMRVSMGDQVLGEVEVTAEQDLGESDLFSFDLPAGTPSGDLRVEFINDLCEGSSNQDRNLHVLGVELDGAELAIEDARLVRYDGEQYDGDHGILWRGALVFDLNGDGLFN